MQEGVASRWEPQAQPAVLGNTISPMLSNRVSFANCMTQLHHNHKEFLKTSSHPQYLALKFPTICAEIKLDGERMVVHIQGGEEGTVTMQTRNGKWYSQLYSPVLGPALRKAISKYRVNVILDGEMEAWDNGRQELIPFGSNRTVANYRRGYLHRHGLLDDRDRNLHNETTDSISIMRAAEESKFVKPVQDMADNDAGKECWLQFLVFDILYVDGPDAKKLLQECGLQDVAATGSIIQLSTLQRKQVLYRLLEEQPNEVEICKALVIRSNGECIRGENYFNTAEPIMEYGHPVTLLDSTQAAILQTADAVQNLEELDRQRRHGKSNVEISRLRSQAVDDFYRKVVEDNRFEGLVIKDLAAPYIFGGESRSRKYWHKFKPDYEKSAVDMDVVILGAYFATGLRHSGKLSHFLCGCLDSDDPSTFMTLCNVNGASVQFEKLDKIMEATGFRRANEEHDMQMGKWFQEEDHGKSLPSFISQRSLQRGKEDFDGWKYSRNKNYPDLWIHPEDSVVLTIYGQELVQSEGYSVGISLRFARISKIRLDSVDGDEKKSSEIDSDQDLWQVYLENMRQRQEDASALDSSLSKGGDQSHLSSSSTSRFLTPEEYGRKSKKRKRKAAVSPSKIPKVETQETNALRGVAFTVLEGNYSLDPNSLEAQEAREHGWIQKALRVKSKEDVMEFILAHGGTIKVSAETNDTYILGGSKNDARVVHFMKGIQYANSQKVAKPKTQKGLKLQRLAEHEGVLKWTFVFILVYQRISGQSRHLEDQDHSTPGAGGNAYGCSIKEMNEGMLEPKMHHYLTRRKVQEGTIDEIIDLRRSGKATKMELMRALQEIEGGDATLGGQQLGPWQYNGVYEMSAQHRWVLASRQGTFWPSTIEETLDEERRVVMYPDIFSSGFGARDEAETVREVLSGVKSERWVDTMCETRDQIASSLPLARAMGALITPRLHTGVTHILCDLKKEDMLEYSISIKSNAFMNVQRGECLLEKLMSVQIPRKIYLVSPVWIRNLWLQRIGN
jgi:DNA ligase-4